MTLDDLTRARITDKIVYYARGTVDSFGGDFEDGGLCLIAAAFALHASVLSRQGKPVEEALLDITQHIATLYPKIYRAAEEAMRELVAKG